MKSEKIQVQNNWGKVVILGLLILMAVVTFI
jgi:hypothetical protein